MAENGSTRRSFLGRLIGGTLLGSAASLVGATLAYLFPPSEVRSALGPGRVRLGKAEQMTLGAGKLTLVDDEPVWVVRVKDGFVGMSAWCTHKSCVVKWEQESRLFRCPCHEGSFDEHGNVVSGLPLRPLRQFQIGLVDGELYVSRRDRRSV